MASSCSSFARRPLSLALNCPDDVWTIEGVSSELPALPYRWASRSHRLSGLGGCIPIRTPRNLAERIRKTPGHSEATSPIVQSSLDNWRTCLAFTFALCPTRAPCAQPNGAGSATINI